MPDLGSVALMADHMIDLHSVSISVQDGIEYFNLAVMFDCNAVQAYFFEGLPDLTFKPHSVPVCFNLVTTFLLSPLGASQTPTFLKLHVLGVVSVILYLLVMKLP